MPVATETYLFSTMVRGKGVLDFNFHPRQLDNRLPAVTGNANAVAMITEVTGDGGIPFQGDASLSVLNTYCSGDPEGFGTVHVRVHVDYFRDLNVRIAFALWV